MAVPGSQLEITAWNEIFFSNLVLALDWFEKKVGIHLILNNWMNQNLDHLNLEYKIFYEIIWSIKMWIDFSFLHIITLTNHLISFPFIEGTVISQQTLSKSVFKRKEKFQGTVEVQSMIMIVPKKNYYKSNFDLIRWTDQGRIY